MSVTLRAPGTFLAENLSTSETSNVAAAVKALEGEGLTPDHAPDSASPSPSSPGLFPQLAPGEMGGWWTSMPAAVYDP